MIALFVCVGNITLLTQERRVVFVVFLSYVRVLVFVLVIL